MKPLFPQIGGLVHGGDYSPEQWLDRPDILREDVRLMQKAGMNSATLGVFAWAALEPEEGVFQLDWLAETMDRLHAAGIYTVLATPTGARPAWLDAKYPQAMRVAPDGRRNRHGPRHSHCMSSPQHRARAEAVIRALAARLGNHPGLMLWHISNELGGECWCDLCRERFTQYLRHRYGNDIHALNHAWWTAFWSHQYSDFDQIEPPWPNGERTTHGLNLDWKRFNTWNMNDYLRFEADLLRSLTPDVPITTNFMRLYPPLDYHVLEKSIDIISWDSYPAWGNDTETRCETAADTAFHHSVMRGLKRDKPFMLMESTPSLVNWHTVNKLKRPGEHRLSSLQAIALGSDSVQYFQWRKGRGSFEQYHGAVVDHLGTEDTRVFGEVAAVGAMLRQLAPVAGSLVKAQTALLFDWDNRWAIADMAALSKERRLYEDTCRSQYVLFHRHGIAMDVVSPLEDLSRYRVVVAPMLYLLKPGVAGALRAFVEAGGQLVATYLTGYANESTLCWLGGFPGDGLGELFGLCAEEIDTLYPTDRNAVRFEGAVQGEYEARDFCEVLRPQGCEVIGRYAADFYAGTPAVTRNAWGKGAAWYVATRLSQPGMDALYQAVWQAAGIEPVALPEGIEAQAREADDARYLFFMNWGDAPQTVDIRPQGLDLLTGAPAPQRLTLPPLGASVIRYAKG